MIGTCCLILFLSIVMVRSIILDTMALKQRTKLPVKLMKSLGKPQKRILIQILYSWNIKVTEKSLGKIDTRGALVFMPIRICFQNSPFYSCMPLNGNVAKDDLVMIQTLLLFKYKLLCYHVNQILIPITTRSHSASLQIIGLATK